MKRFSLLLLPVVLLMPGCRREVPAPSSTATSPAPTPVTATGLHNVYRLTDKLLSGSSPDGDAGFRSLRELGVQTIISVDGARPDVATARKYGLRYVHLPIGYDGVPAEQGRRIARAVRDLPGAVYLHCHHGKHRGPAAAAVAKLCLDASCPAEEAIAWLRQAGTDPHYRGLYGSVEHFLRPTAEELDRLPADYPEAAPVPALAQAMVAIDETWERLKKVRAAGWKPPPGHADLDPPHEALQLREHYHEAGRLPDVQNRSEELRRWLIDAEQAAKELESTLRGKEAEAAERAFRKSAAACVQCHARHRDQPRER